MTADNNQVRRPLAGRLDDLSRRLANVNEFEGRRLQRGALTEGGKQSFAVLLRQRDEFRCRNPAFRSIGIQRGINDVNQCDFGAEGSRAKSKPTSAARAANALWSTAMRIFRKLMSNLLRANNLSAFGKQSKQSREPDQNSGRDNDN